MAGYVLEIVEGPEAGRVIPLSGPLELGRDASAGIALQQDELVSRRHVRISPDENGALVEDLGSRNGTFVDGDEIHSPAHLAVDGQLLVGVTLLQLRTAAMVASGATVLRPIPAEFTTMRPLPAVAPAATTMRQVPSASALAVPESEPDYVPASALGQGPGAADLFSLLDVHTKGKAKGAPIGIFVLVAVAAMLYFGLR